MQLDARTFELHRSAHRAGLAAHGWRILRQVGPGSALIKRAVRLLRNSSAEYWRTYWVVESATGARGFAKVFFGNKPEFNLILAKKEVELVAYFRQQLPPLPAIRLPVVFDHWADESTAYVVLEPRRVTLMGLSELAADARLWRELERLLEALSPIPPPPWWNRGWETHNFASLPPGTPHDSPFDIDFDQNLAIEPDGTLYFHDFEKRRWARHGMQEILLALKLLGNGHDPLAVERAKSLLGRLRLPSLEVIEESLRAVSSSLSHPGQAEDRKRMLVSLLAPQSANDATAI